MPIIVCCISQISQRSEKNEQWSTEWWRYILSTPKIPIRSWIRREDTAPSSSMARYGFWEEPLRVPAGVTRTCSIPEGTALFFPLVNGVDVNTAAQPVWELRAEVAGCIDAAYNLSLEVDGQAIPAKELMRSRVRSVPFVAVFPADGVPTTPPAPAGIYSPVG